MTRFRTLDDFDFSGKRVLLRADLNVPMKDGQVTDTSRLDRVAPTIAELCAAGARVIVLSHFGRPKGRVVPEMSLAPVARALSDALGGAPVGFSSATIGDAAEAAVAALKPGEVLVLENLRFHPGEEANAPDFAAALAELGDIYVNDAFSAAHRAHASTEALAHLLPSAAGRLMQEEIEALSKALDKPERPLIAIVGGAKVSTKLALLGNLVARVDTLVIGGGMANTFLHAKGVAVGRSLCERDLAETARGILTRAEAEGCAIVLPEDAVVARALAPGVETHTLAITAVPDDAMILDIGPASAARVCGALAGCRTLVWNGPVGAFETPPFDAATRAIAGSAAALTSNGRLMSVAGGGDTVAALRAAGVLDQLTYVSAAGGAFLEWLEGRALPGVAALKV